MTPITLQCIHIDLDWPTPQIGRADGADARVFAALIRDKWDGVLKRFDDASGSNTGGLMADPSPDRIELPTAITAHVD